MNDTKQIDSYEKAQLPNGSVHMLWTADGVPQEMLCGASKGAAVTYDLLKARVTCRVCRERAIAIVAGEDSPRLGA
jgi:hypothetical protein